MARTYKTLTPEQKARKADTRKAWKQANPEKHAASSRLWHAANREKAAATSKEWREANLGWASAISWKSNLRRKYGLTPADYAWYAHRYGRRDPLCDVCGKAKTEHGKAIAVDHCHETGEVRGLLCFTCNSAIGKLGDNEEGVQRALDYLKDKPFTK